jgi:hypothetical protein
MSGKRNVSMLALGQQNIGNGGAEYWTAEWQYILPEDRRVLEMSTVENWTTGRHYFGRKDCRMLGKRNVSMLACGQQNFGHEDILNRRMTEFLHEG